MDSTSAKPSTLYQDRVKGGHSDSPVAKCDYCRLGYRSVGAKEVSSGLLCLGVGSAFLAYTLSSWVIKINRNEPRDIEFFADSVSPASAIVAMAVGVGKIKGAWDEAVCTCKKSGFGNGQQVVLVKPWDV